MVRKPGKHQIIFEINRVTTVTIIILFITTLFVTIINYYKKAAIREELDPHVR